MKQYSINYGLKGQTTMKGKYHMNYSFTTYTTSTSYATTEHAILSINGYDVAHGTNKWYNRPWYQYRYQNVCYDAISDAIQDIKNAIKRDYMTANNYGRLTAKRSHELEALYNANNQIISLRQLKLLLNNASYEVRDRLNIRH